jgi:thiol-disulfide isomerase/thioredoxin
MPALTTLLSDYFNPKKMFFWMLLLVILLIGVAMYVYSTSKSSKSQLTDIPNANGRSGEVVVMIFTVDWCPHCKKAKDPWNTFVEGYHNKTFNNYTVKCVEYNLSEVDGVVDEVAKSASAKYKVEGYPTIKMVKDGQVIEFDAKVTTYSLQKFLEDMV